MEGIISLAYMLGIIIFKKNPNKVTSDTFHKDSQSVSIQQGQ